MQTNNGFDDLDYALYHLVFIGNSIKNNVDAFNDIINKCSSETEQLLYISTYSLITIQTISFLDEYHNNLRSNDVQEMSLIIEIKRALSPAIKQINEWKEMRDFRNVVLAHNLRDDKAKESVFKRGVTSFDTPQNALDLMVLLNCIKAVKNTIQTAFKTRLELFQSALDQSGSRPIATRYKTEAEAVAAITAVYSKINANLLELKSKYSQDIEVDD